MRELISGARLPHCYKVRVKHSDVGFVSVPGWAGTVLRRQKQRYWLVLSYTWMQRGCFLQRFFGQTKCPSKKSFSRNT